MQVCLLANIIHYIYIFLVIEVNKPDKDRMIPRTH